MPRTCPAPRCGSVIRDDQVACPTHWFQLPDELRDRIWKLYRFEPRGLAHVRAINEAVGLLRASA